MIRYITSIPNSIAHWLIEDPSILRVELVQLESRAGTVIVTYDDLGLLDQGYFAADEPVAVALPVGKWKQEVSKDAVNYTPGPFGTLESYATSRGPGLRLNFNIGTSLPFPAMWSRFTKV